MNHMRAAFSRGETILALALVLGSFTPSAHGTIISVGDVLYVDSDPKRLYIGYPNTGMVEVKGGSVLDAAAGLGAFTSILVGVDSSGVGTLTVDGTGSKVVSSIAAPEGGLNVGLLNGTGTVRITNGGSAEVQGAALVGTSGGNGTLQVSGASTAEIKGDLYVGSSGGTGAVEVALGGHVKANQVQVAGGGMGSLRVDGTGSFLDLASRFQVGVTGSGSAAPTGSAEIAGGGVVTAQTGMIGAFAGSNGIVTVSGAGSALNLVTGTTPVAGRASLEIGREQMGRLDILAGGKARIDAAAVGTTSMQLNIGGGSGSFAGLVNGEGTLNIDGPGSELRIVGIRPAVSIGRQGTATVNITSGGKLITENTEANSNSFVARTPTAKASVSITGAGSEWQAGRRLYIGSDVSGGVPQPGGVGMVNVSDGGKLQVAGTDSRIFIGASGKLAGNGTVTGDVVNEGTIKPGNSPGIMSLFGNLTLNAAGIVELELGGINVALAQYDQLNAYDDPGTASVEGTITLGGTLRVSLLTGFDPLQGNFFDVFTALDIIDGLPSYELPALSGGRYWQHSIVGIGDSREALRLTVLQDLTVPEPGSLSLLALAAGAALIGRRRPSRAVTPRTRDAS